MLHADDPDDEVDATRGELLKQFIDGAGGRDVAACFEERAADLAALGRVGIDERRRKEHAK